MINIKIKRVYEPPSNDDGFKVLVERLWPQGISKLDNNIDLWEKEIAPSPELLLDFETGTVLWPEFEQKYIEELRYNKTLDILIKTLRSKEKVTLLHDNKDYNHNPALVLMKILEQKL